MGEPCGNYAGCYYGYSLYDHTHYFGFNLELDCATGFDHSSNTGNGLFGYGDMTTTDVDMNETDYIGTTDVTQSAESAEIIDSAHGIPLETVQLIVVILSIVIGAVLLMISVACCCVHCRKVRDVRHKMRRMASRQLQMEQYLL